MKRLAFLIGLIIFGAVAAFSKYTIFNFQGKVQVEKNGELVPVQKEMELKFSDVLVLDKGASLEILNTMNSKIYKTDHAGLITVQQIFINGRSENALNDITKNVKFTRGKSRESNVYIDNGAVKRSMAIYDKDGSNIEVDPKTLSHHIVKLLNNLSSYTATEIPGNFNYERTDEGGLIFSFENTQDFPLYFNVIKIRNNDKNEIVISELGQPTGCYSLLPGQSVTREQANGLNPEEEHILIITPYNFDMDELLNNVDLTLSNNEEIIPDDNLPVYMFVM